MAEHDKRREKFRVGQKRKMEKPKRKTRRYSPKEERAIIEIAAQHPGNAMYSGVRAAARATGVPVATVQNMMDRNRSDLEELRVYNREQHIALFQDRTVMCLEQIAPTRKASENRDLMVAAGVGTDKALLLQGQPTQVYAHLHEHTVKLDELGMRLLKALNGPGAEGASLEACQEQNPRVIDGEIEESAVTLK